MTKYLNSIAVALNVLPLFKSSSAAFKEKIIIIRENQHKIRKFNFKISVGYLTVIQYLLRYGNSWSSHIPGSFKDFASYH